MFGQLSRVRVAHDVEAFGVGLHQAVLDAVVNHLDEMTRACGAAMQITFFRRALYVLAARSAGDPPSTGREGFEDRLEAPEDLFLAADHQTIAALGAPDAARRADVEIMDALLFEHLRAAHVVFEMRIAAVNDDVAGGHRLRPPVDGLFSRGAGGDHRPDGARLSHLFDQFLDRSRAARAFALQLLDALGVEVEDEALVPAPHQTANHVGAHPAQANHSQLH